MTKDEADTVTGEILATAKNGDETPIAIITREIQALNIVEDYAIGSRNEAESANDALQRVKGLVKRIAEAKDHERRPLNERLKEIAAAYAPAEDLLKDAETTLKRAMLSFTKAENARIEQERQKQIELAAAERARLEAEARKLEEAAAAKAEKLRAKGQDEKADAAVQIAASQANAARTVAAMVAAPSKPQEATKFAGTGIRKVWKARVDNMPKFLAGLAASQVYDASEFVQVNQTALNRLAGSLKGNLDKAMPGTFSWEEESMSARSK